MVALLADQTKAQLLNDSSGWIVFLDAAHGDFAETEILKGKPKYLTRRLGNESPVLVQWPDPVTKICSVNPPRPKVTGDPVETNFANDGVYVNDAPGNIGPLLPCLHDRR